MSESKNRKLPAGTCETCANYTYDEESEDYVCDAWMDEDDMGQFLKAAACPFYRNGDEYRVVRHQM